MHDIFVGRQPIYNRDLSVFGYELLYRATEFSDVSDVAGDEANHQATAQVVLNAFLEFGLDSIVGDRQAFINVPRNFLTGEIPLPLPENQVILEVLEDTRVDEPLVAGVRNLVEKGFTLALDDFILDLDTRKLLDVAKLVKIDIQQLSRDELNEHIQNLAPFNVKLLAEKVETHNEFEFTKQLGFDYFQGYFLSRPKLIQGQTVGASRLALVRLLAQLQDPNTGFNELEAIIRQDVALSYKLLRYLNSAFFSFSKPVESIRHGLVYLGLRNVKDWVTVMALTRIDDKPSSLIGTALARARMCELMAEATQSDAATHYTVGLLSTLDAMLDMPMTQVLETMPLSEDISAALLHEEGALGQTLKCTRAYETSDWGDVNHPKLDVSQITDIYFQAIQWADRAVEDLIQTTV